MKHLILSIFLALAASDAIAQKSHHCPARELSEDVLFTICTHERGMAPLMQPRLYFKAYTNGMAEYEVEESRTLVTKPLKLSDAELKGLVGILALPEMLETKNDYPAVKLFTDSSTETHMLMRVGDKAKSVLLRNFLIDDRDVAARYPAALVLLMRTVSDYRDRAMGVVKQIPHLSFDSMINYPDFSNYREIMIYADYQHRAMVTADGKISSRRDILFDHEGRSGLEVDMYFDATPDETAAMKKTLARAREERFGGRGRILVRGRYDQRVDPMSRQRIRKFYAKQVMGIEPIDLPYRGEIKLGWNYSDTFDRRVDDKDIGLSSPLILPFHHAGRIEWQNAGQFPQLSRPGRHSIIFQASSQTTHQYEPGRWNETFHLTILEVR